MAGFTTIRAVLSMAPTRPALYVQRAAGIAGHEEGVTVHRVIPELGPFIGVNAAERISFRPYQKSVGRPHRSGIGHAHSLA